MSKNKTFKVRIEDKILVVAKAETRLRGISFSAYIRGLMIEDLNFSFKSRKIPPPEADIVGIPPGTTAKELKKGFEKIDDIMSKYQREVPKPKKKKNNSSETNLDVAGMVEAQKNKNNKSK